LGTCSSAPTATSCSESSLVLWLLSRLSMLDTETM
jgi:hypothetical protein